jgi:hypothetical protein
LRESHDLGDSLEPNFPLEDGAGHPITRKRSHLLAWKNWSFLKRMSLIIVFVMFLIGIATLVEWVLCIRHSLHTLTWNTNGTPYFKENLHLKVQNIHLQEFQWIPLQNSSNPNVTENFPNLSLSVTLQGQGKEFEDSNPSKKNAWQFLRTWFNKNAVIESNDYMLILETPSVCLISSWHYQMMHDVGLTCKSMKQLKEMCAFFNESKLSDSKTLNSLGYHNITGKIIGNLNVSESIPWLQDEIAFVSTYVPQLIIQSNFQYLSQYIQKHVLGNPCLVQPLRFYVVGKPSIKFGKVIKIRKQIIMQTAMEVDIGMSQLNT